MPTRTTTTTASPTLAVAVVVALATLTTCVSAWNVSDYYNGPSFSSFNFHDGSFAYFPVIYGEWATLPFYVKLGADVKESQTTGTTACSPIFYPGGFTMFAYIPPSATSLPGAVANAPVTFQFMEVFYPNTHEFAKVGKHKMPFKKSTERTNGAMYIVPANSGGAACVSYEGTQTIEFFVYLAVGPSMQGQRNMNAVYGVLGVLVTVFIMRFVTSFKGGKPLSPATTLYESFVTATYYPGLDMPLAHLRFLEMVAFCMGVMVSAINPANSTPYVQGSNGLWPSEFIVSDENDYYTTLYVPLSTPLTVMLVCLAPLAQLAAGAVCVILSKIGSLAPPLSRVAPVCYGVLMALSVSYTFIFLPPAYDYRMQARTTRFAITFGSQMLLWMGVIRPILSRFTLVTVETTTMESNYADL